MPTGDGETVCNQRLEKVLADLEAAEKLIAALRAENESRQRKEAIDAGIIAQQDKLIALLEKQRRRQLSIFFGLVKVRF